MKTFFDQEISAGNRFSFGDNWKKFLTVINNERITEAENSLKQMLDVDDLKGKSFLDIGSGSGLFSLAARRLGATVYSFDYDPRSVVCAQELKLRCFPEDTKWTIEEGSILNEKYMKSIGCFDIVYAWGVLHHTGAMRQALKNSIIPLAPGGDLFVSIYNDQGRKSEIWRNVKKFYNSFPFGKHLIIIIFVPYFILGGLFMDILKIKNPIKRYSDYKNYRGMSRVYDWIDWLGGYPFEVSKPEEIFYVYHKSGLVLEKIKTCGGGLGCNEFIFKKR